MCGEVDALTILIFVDVYEIFFLYVTILTWEIFIIGPQDLSFNQIHNTSMS